MRAAILLVLTMGVPVMAQPIRLPTPPPKTASVEERLDRLLTVVEQLSQNQVDLSMRIAALEGKAPPPVPVPPPPVPVPVAPGKLQILVGYTDEILITPGRKAMVTGPEFRTTLEQYAPGEYRIIDLAKPDGVEPFWKDLAGHYEESRLVILRDGKIVYDNDLPFTAAGAVERIVKYSISKPAKVSVAPTWSKAGTVKLIDGYYYRADGNGWMNWCNECNGISYADFVVKVNQLKAQQQATVANPTRPGGSPGYSNTLVTPVRYAVTRPLPGRELGLYGGITPTGLIPTRVLGAARVGSTSGCATGG